MGYQRRVHGDKAPELRMKQRERTQLLVLVAALTWISGTRAEHSCQDFTVSNCEVDRDLWIAEFNISSVTQCQHACHSFANCKAFTFYQNQCELWKDNPRTSCAVISGPPDLDLELCWVGDIATEACDGYVEEECEFLGSDTGFSIVDGEIISAEKCQEYCLNWSDFGGCNYWVYNETSKSCLTLDSKLRYCWGFSGPKDPAIQECLPCEEEQTMFHPVEYLDLRPEGSDGCLKSSWNLTAGEDGNEVWGVGLTCASVALGDMMYQDVEFTGSFTPLNGDDDWIGFVFGYEDDGHFYLVLAPGAMATHASQTNNDWRLVKVESETGLTSYNMTAAILSGVDVAGQTKVVYRPEVSGWNRDKVYSWRVRYQPTLKDLEISVMEDEVELWTKTWQNDFQEELYTGKLGLFQHSQPTRFFDLAFTELCYQ